MRRLPLLLVGITGFIALRHGGYCNCRFGAHSFSLTPAGVHHNFSINDRFFIFLAFVVIVF